MKRIHIIGRKNSGKTTLVAELVRELTSQGYKVGTIKHTHHRHELDTPGKDSHKHREAGAAVVGILSPALNAVFWQPEEVGDSADDARYEQFSSQFKDCDLVLVEGDTQATHPRLEVWRAEVGSTPLSVADPSIAAIITDDALEANLPMLPRSDVSAVAKQILALLT